MTLALLLLSGITLLLLGGHYLVRHAVELAANLNESLLVIGSTIFNLLGISGIIALVSPIDVGAQLIETDIGILLAASEGVVVLALALGRLGRRAGLLLLTIYAAYILQLG